MPADFADATASTLADPQSTDTGAHLIDHTKPVIAGNKRRFILYTGILALPDNGVGKACAGGKHLHAHFAGARLRQLFYVFQMELFGAAKRLEDNAAVGHIIRGSGGE